MRKLVLFFALFMANACLAQMPKQWSASEIYQKIDKLNVLGNVLYVAAHPDDENQRFITYCANEKLYNTAYLSLTRGDGGQNLIGTEIREELGIIRTQELLGARRTDGGQQFFSRANDFGYSKNPEETLEIWDKDKILADVVWVIRKFRPDVIVCRFPTDGGGGHGHHTASAQLAMEAFDIAGDANKYPEQLKFVDVWQPVRIVVNTGRWWNDTISAEDPGVVTEDIGQYNELLGTSYNELAARSRSNHKCQGFGATGSRGEYVEYFEHKKGLEANKSLFDGYASDWSRVDGWSNLESLAILVKKNFNISNPSASIKDLIAVKKELVNMKDPFWRETKLKEVEELILHCAGIYIEASSDDYAKTTGDSVKVSFELINRGEVRTRVNTIGSNELDYSEHFARTMKNNDKLEIERAFVVPKMNTSDPYWLVEGGSLGSNIVSDQKLIGTPENAASVNFQIELMVEGEALQLTYPLIYKWNDPVDGESYRPFIIAPKVVANIEHPIYLFSDQSAQTMALTLKANADNQQGIITVDAPAGWHLDYTKEYAFDKKGEELKVLVKITPNAKSANGQLKVSINGQLAKAMNTITYDHIPTQVWFPMAETKLVYVDIKKTGNKLGYVLGAGDVVPDGLRNIGYEVDILEEGDISPENLSKYDAILIGIRYFNVNERCAFVMPKLLKYVENGGNLIVQYNTRHRMKTQDFGPYPITLSRERVTQEDAEVKFLKKDHPVLNTPNKLTKADFDGWVQERGLYFPNKWDEKYDAVLSWHDKGETAKDGSLLVTKYGKGNYVYTGISFFRELPAGVPGAYRLLVNLISL